MHTVTKQMQALSPETRAAVMNCMTTLVGNDGDPSVKDILFMEKIHIALDIDQNDYMAKHQHVVEAQNIKNKRPTKKTFVLDPLKIATLQSETAIVDAFLQGIFIPDMIGPVVAPTKSSCLVKLESTTILAPQESTNVLDIQFEEMSLDKIINDGPSVSIRKMDEPPYIDDIEHRSKTIPLMPGLDSAHDAFARLILTRSQWLRSELKTFADDLNIMLDGALERLNDASFDTHDTHFTDGDDPIEINPELKETLLS
jgi:hypothetical protein